MIQGDVQITTFYIYITYIYNMLSDFFLQNNSCILLDFAPKLKRHRSYRSSRLRGLRPWPCAPRSLRGQPPSPSCRAGRVSPRRAGRPHCRGCIECTCPATRPYVKCREGRRSLTKTVFGRAEGCRNAGRWTHRCAFKGHSPGESKVVLECLTKP